MRILFRLLPFVIAFAFLFPSCVFADAGYAVGDKIAVMKDVQIREPLWGDAVAIFGDINSQSTVDGDVIAIAGSITVDGSVSGDIVCIFGKVNLSPGASVSGDVISIGGYKKAPGARVGGREVVVLGEGPGIDLEIVLIIRALFIILFSFAVLVLGLLLIAVSKERFGSLLKDMDIIGATAMGKGIFILAAATLITVVFFFTAFAPLLYLALNAVGAVLSGIYFGRLVLRALNSNFNVYAQFITGLLTITLFKILIIFSVPHLNLLADIGVSLALEVLINSVGVGIIASSRLRSKKAPV